MAYGDSRVTIHMASSLDGYIARADGKPSLFMPAISAHSCMNSYGQRSAISGLLVAVPSVAPACAWAWLTRSVIR